MSRAGNIKMKVADKLVLLLDAADGFAAAVSGALHPNPNSKSQTQKDSFELSLERYGVKDRKASGEMIHFIDSNGSYEVSILILQNYELPLLACALNEVLLELAGDDLSKMPALIVPFILPESKLKQENKTSVKSDNVSVYSVKVGPTADVIEALSSRLKTAPPYLQIYHEGLATLLHLINVVKLPTIMLIGVTCEHISKKTSEEEIEVICEIGDHLATALSVSFSKEKVPERAAKKSRDNREAWRALYQ